MKRLLPFADNLKASNTVSTSQERCGLTAIEVLVSTVLASLLMVAMLGMMRGLRIQSVALDTQFSEPIWRQNLDRLLQQDFENSRTCELTERSILLRGYGGRDNETGKATLRSALIIYEVAEIDDHSWLIRRERPIVTNSLSPEHRELVLHGVKKIRSINLSPASKIKSEGQNSAASLDATDAFVIEQLSLELWGSGNEEAIYAFDFRRP